MFRRKQVVQNEVVATTMRAFFRYRRPDLWTTDPLELARIAQVYGSYLLNLWTSEIYPGKTTSLETMLKGSRSRFTIGLSTQAIESPDFEQLTRRAALVSDTLLLSHDGTAKLHELDVKVWSGLNTPLSTDERHAIMGHNLLIGAGEYDGSFEHPDDKRVKNSDSVQVYGMHCANLEALGRWVRDTKPLLTAGLVWYLPRYSIETRAALNGKILQRVDLPERFQAVDYLIRDGRAVDASGAEPLKSRLVRPVLQVDLPFIEGVNLRDFSKITVGEFAAFSAFRDFLRHSFIDMDDAMNAVAADRELVKLGLQIKDQVRAVGVELGKARRKRAVSVTGAVIGSVGATLVAVYGPALAAAVAAVGAGGGLWGIIHAATENSTRYLREDKWYYVWMMDKKSSTRF
jgi:hypothetical protein